MKILADASLPNLEQFFPAPFILTCYHQAKEIPNLIAGQEILLCRATLKVNQQLLQGHTLRYVATATSGLDHLDLDWLEKEHIKVLDAKGANATAVADYVMACFAYLRHHKLFSGVTAGVIGMGHVGSIVARRLSHCGLKVVRYDPPKELVDKDFQSCSLRELQQVDLISIHAELHDRPFHPTTNLLDHNFLASLKPQCVLINAARGGIAAEQSLPLFASQLIYCTDVYDHEPDINPQIIEQALLCTPHIAGHSIEAKYRALAIISENLHRLYDMDQPLFNPPLPDKVQFSKEQTWEQQLLSLYDPSSETHKLKTAPDKRAAFLDLRKQHNKRHDFNQFLYPELGDNMKLCLGGDVNQH